MSKHTRTKAELLARMSSRHTQEITTHTIDLLNAQAPERVYAGKECAVEFKHNFVEIMFAQRERGTDTLRSMIVITMPPANVIYLLHSIKQMKSPSLSEIAQQLDLKTETLSKFNVEAKQTAEMSAQVVGVAIAGLETCMDFYKVPPPTIVKFKAKGGDMLMEPQVRVETRTTLLIGLLEELDKLRAGFPAHAIWAEGKHHDSNVA